MGISYLQFIEVIQILENGGSWKLAATYLN